MFCIEEDHNDTTSKSTYGWTIRLTGREIDLLRFALEQLIKSPGDSDKKALAKELFNELSGDL